MGFAPCLDQLVRGRRDQRRVNCVDRHLPKRANQTAIIWEGDSLDKSKLITYAELHEQVNKFANVL